MTQARSAALALLLSAAGLAAASATAQAAHAVPPPVGQHATVMNNIYQAQQRNNAAISHVQNNIRSTQPRY